MLVVSKESLSNEALFLSELVSLQTPALYHSALYHLLSKNSWLKRRDLLPMSAEYLHNFAMLGGRYTKDALHRIFTVAVELGRSV